MFPATTKKALLGDLQNHHRLVGQQPQAPSVLEPRQAADGRDGL